MNTTRTLSSFLPSKAYGIIGHGIDAVEHKEYFKVPNDCIIVVKAYPSEATRKYYIDKYLNKLFNPERKSIYENPLCYIPEIIDDFGSVIIFKPGDKCPNFYLSLYPYVEEILNKTIEPHYGIVPLKETLLNPDAGDVQFGYTDILDNSSDTLSDLYINSVYPTKAEVNDDLKESIDSSLTVEQICDMFKKKHNDIFFYEYTMTEILGVGRDNKADRPGVYYHFVCRSGLHTDKYYEYNSSRLKENIKSNIASYHTAPRAVKKIIRNKISEAEMYRKHLLKGTKYNKYSGTRQGNRNTRRGGYTRRMRRYIS